MPSGVTHAKKIYISGGLNRTQRITDHVFDEILEFTPGEGWRVVDKMLFPRSDHAVSTVPIEDIKQYCD